MEKFFTWQYLATFAGASCATAVVTQFLDRLLNQKKKIPTQVIAYLVAFAVLLLGHAFTNGLTVSEGFLCVFNALLVSSATSGTISGMKRLMQG